LGGEQGESSLSESQTWGETSVTSTHANPRGSKCAGVGRKGGTVAPLSLFSFHQDFGSGLRGQERADSASYTDHDRAVYEEAKAIGHTNSMTGWGDGATPRGGGTKPSPPRVNGRERSDKKRYQEMNSARSKFQLKSQSWR